MMLKDILIKRELSIYRISKDTGIAYTTLNDLVVEKTDIRRTSAEVLYRLAKYLKISMETLYEDSLGITSENNFHGVAVDKDSPMIGIWWWTDDQIIGVSISKENGANIDGLIHYSDTENHVTLWKQVLKDNYGEHEYLKIYEKGFKSLYRGRVYYDPRTACYEITCSRNIIDDKNFRNKVVEFYNLQYARKEFVALHHYEFKRALTGNMAVDEDYYESSF